MKFVGNNFGERNIACRAKKRRLSCHACILVIIMPILLIAFPVIAQSGGGFDLEWSTVDNGGGRSTGGLFVLNGSIGQPDAGQVSGGGYVVKGGSWGGGVLAVVEHHIYLPSVSR